MKEVIEYPELHDKIRAERASGISVKEISRKHKLSTGRIAQILTPNWKAMLLVYQWRRGPNQSKPYKIDNFLHLVDDYDYLPVKGAPKTVLRPFHVEDNMSIIERNFTPIKRFENGISQTGASIKCSECGKTEEYYVQSGTVKHRFIGPHFQRRGWNIGGGPNADRCPECLAKLKVPKMAELIKASKGEPIKSLADIPKDVIKPVSPMPEVPVIATVTDKTATEVMKVLEPVKETSSPNTEMSRTDRRIIFAKLNDTYQDEDMGYKGSWSDDRIAVDLGTPVEWVAQVREESFGPAVGRSTRISEFTEASKFIDEKAKDLADIILAQAKRDSALTATIATFNKQITEISDADVILKAKLEQFGKELATFKELAEEIKALV